METKTAIAGERKPVQIQKKWEKQSRGKLEQD